jgi:hypothetical protein
VKNPENVIMRPQNLLLDESIPLDGQLDQRQAQRHEFSHAALVSVLGTGDQILHGEIRNVSKGGTQLHLEEPLGTGSLLRVEYNNNLLLGEVVYCQREQGGWVIGIRAEHVLSGLTALADAMRGV